MSRFLAVLVFVCLVLGAVGRSYGDDPHDEQCVIPECSYISPREVGSLILQAASVAASHCPEAPACVCPPTRLAGEYVVCKQRWDGKVTRCKRMGFRPLSE